MARSHSDVLRESPHRPEPSARAVVFMTRGRSLQFQNGGATDRASIQSMIHVACPGQQ